MKSKNIFIAISVFGIGFVLYKVLIGFVLPIALFVSLGYILKVLLKKSDPDQGGNFLDALNSDSCMVQNAKLEPCLNDPGLQTYQFERLGYFKKDKKLSSII